ncbi:LytR/AlgR family response regulator transcription factor [Fibrella forsythiae]|uniref:Response regulator transcription factor n=1 Tax=Fibrella forsythiae TaxID=2817061 RepID=A0ABS3JGP5_9BACT|nr:response regulator transcription factor [Fibrella forsythiae]MBO0949181.1 response regulator transcription factor [Fibrella forsythiae]
MKFLIVDDEPQARKLLQTYMQELSQFQLVKLCANALEAYEALHVSQVDLLFLDVKMPIVSGTDFLRSLKSPPLVILTTAYPQYALEGFELNVVDYLLKPIALPRLLQALDKAQHWHQAVGPLPPAPAINHIFIKVDSKRVKILLSAIQLVEGLQNYVKIHLTDKVLVAGYSMKAMEELLPADQFLRVHRSFIVPTDSIIAVNGNLIETPYHNVPIGVSYREQVNQLTKIP